MPRIINVFDAAKYGDYEEFLRWYGGDPNAEDRGLFLLESAVLGRQDEAERRRIVSRLLADGADPNAEMSAGQDCLIVCLKDGARYWSAEGLQWLVATLISSGIDVHRRDAWGNDALMLSVRNVRSDDEALEPVWRELLAAGADPTIPGPQGKSTLDFAAETKKRRGFAEIAKEYGYSG